MLLYQTVIRKIQAFNNDGKANRNIVKVNTQVANPLVNIVLFYKIHVDNITTVVTH